jgi:hypothetical protein
MRIALACNKLRPKDKRYDLYDVTLRGVCGGDKLGHGSGGIMPAAGGAKLCHL